MEELRDVRVNNFSINCDREIDTRYISCYKKNMNVRVINDSKRTINGLTFEYEIGVNVDCGGALGRTFFKDIRILPGQSASFVETVSFDDAGPTGVMAGCVRFRGANTIE